MYMYYIYYIICIYNVSYIYNILYYFNIFNIFNLITIIHHLIYMIYSLLHLECWMCEHNQLIFLIFKVIHANWILRL